MRIPLLGDVRRKVMQIGWDGLMKQLPVLAASRAKDWCRLRKRLSEEQSFDRQRGVETAKWLRPGVLDVPEELLPHITGYEAAPLEGLTSALQAVETNCEDMVFIDIGAGKGRAMIAAAEMGFKQVIGVEISARLAEVAHANMKAFACKTGCATKWEVVTCDARAYQFPRSNQVVFMYNPFDGGILEGVIARVAQRVHEDQNLQAFIVYYNPVYRSVIDTCGAFKVRSERDKYLVYERNGPAS